MEQRLRMLKPPEVRNIASGQILAFFVIENATRQEQGAKLPVIAKVPV
jgi:hypothetical protein